jgi:hypothetical protein
VTEPPDDWSELADGKVRIGDDAAVPVRMSRWHWRTLRFLSETRQVDVPAALAQIRPLAPEVTNDQLVMWYVELALDAIDEVDAADGSAVETSSS